MTQAFTRPAVRTGRALLYVYPFCNLGGVASVIKQRLPYLLAAGYRVDGLFAFDYGGAPGLRECGATNVFIESELMPALMPRIGEYDVICIVDMPEVAKAVAALAPAARLVYEIHSGIESVVLKNDNESLLACESIIVPSQWLKDLVLKRFPLVTPERIVVCPNIVDEEAFRPSDGPTPTSQGDVIWVGKIDEHKNWREALHILARYFLEQTAAEGILVTGGRLTDALMDDVLRHMQALGVAKRVHWLHNVPYSKMVDLYGRVARSQGSLLQCSRSESFGMVVHEAARCGVPAVSRRSGAVAEFVSHGESGWIYDDEDIEGAAAGLLALATDSVLRERVLRGLRTRLDAYRPDQLGRDYVRVIEAWRS